MTRLRQGYVGQAPAQTHKLLERVLTVYQDGGNINDMLPSKGKIRDDLVKLGVIDDEGNECFAGVEVVPLVDIAGNIVNLGTVDGARLASLPPGIWNMPASKIYSELWLVATPSEGLAVQQAGYDNVIAAPSLEPQDLNSMVDHGVTRLKAVGDVEVAEDERIAVDRIPPPPSMLPEALAAYLAQPTAPEPPKGGPAVEAVEGGFAVTYGIRRYEVRGLDKAKAGKLKATIRVEHAGKLHVDSLDLYQARARKNLAQDVAMIFEQPADTIIADVNKLLITCEQVDLDDLADKPATPSMPTADRKTAEALGKDPKLFERITEDYLRCGFVGETANKLLCYVAAVSRRMTDPLSVLVLSSSGAGKSALQEATLRFCPPEDVVKLTSVSEKALFYKDPDSLKHKVLSVEEGEGADNATYAIRNLISAGELVIESTVKREDGKLGTMANRVEGPTAVFITTTRSDTDAETKSRFIVLSIDESASQTRDILAMQRKARTLAGKTEDRTVEQIIATHQNFQRLLQQVVVVNPFAEELTFADNRLQCRRDQPKYLNLIDAVAFLRQMQKQFRHHKGMAYVEVDKRDIELANQLAAELLGHSLEELSSPARTLLDGISDMVERIQKRFTENVPTRQEVTFSRRDIREHLLWGQDRIHRYISELIDLEYVVRVSGRNGTKHSYCLAYDGQGKDGSKFMLGIRDAAELTV